MQPETTDPPHLIIMHALAQAVENAVYFKGDLAELQQAKDALDSYKRYCEDKK